MADEMAAEEALKKKYGALPTQKGLLDKRLKGADKKYFDSADWAKDKASEQPVQMAINSRTPPTAAAGPQHDSLLPPPPLTK